MDKKNLPLRRKDKNLLKKIYGTMTENGRNVSLDKYKASGQGQLKGKTEAYHFQFYKNEHFTGAQLRKLDKLLTKIIKPRNKSPAEPQSGIEIIKRLPTENATGFDRAKFIFECFAEARDISQPECLLEFLELCNKNNFPLVAFENNPQGLKKTIEDLRKYITGINNNPNPKKNADINDSNENLNSIKSNSDNPETFSCDIHVDLFRHQIERLSTNFFERKYIFQEIDIFLNKNNCGFITVRGEAGAGKSAILANAVQKYKNSEKLYCVYFFISTGSGFNDTVNFIEYLYKQLDRIYDLSSLKENYNKLSNTTEYPRYGYFVKELIETVAIQKEKKLLIIVDALDEIFRNDPTKVRSETNLLYIPKELPQNVFFLISSRNSQQQNYKGAILELSLEKDQLHQQQDIRGYIKKQTEREDVKKWIQKNKLATEAFIELLCEKSEYRFIYLFHVFQDISEFDKDSLPNGIIGYYHDQYNRLLIDEDGKEKREVILAGLSYFRPDISLNRLSIFCRAKPHKLNKLIKHWFDIRLIDKIEQSGTTYLKFSHLSFYEFIEDHVNDIKTIYESPKLHSNLAKKLIKDIFISDESESVSYSEAIFSDKMKTETIKLIPESFLWSQNSHSLSDYLSNRAFCKEYIDRIGEKNIINFLEKICNSARYSKSKDDIVEKFYKNIVSRREDKNPILSIEKIQSIAVHDPDTEFMICYRVAASKYLKEKANRA